MTMNWKSGLLSCTDDPQSCCYGFLCCPCLAFEISGKLEENRSLPLCDICGAGAFSAMGIPLVVPPAALALRIAMRNKYNIQGSLLKDMIASCFCVWCTYCQMHRELKHHSVQDPVNMQPKPK